ncbi:MAG: replication-associated recombination protein A [Candidatus Omnitrophota bacterium]
MDLFEDKKMVKTVERHKAPLAARMRPRTLEEFAGQEHILGEGKLLRRAIDADRISSLILYGPPGTGKTTLAYVISNIAKSHFEKINATTSSVAEMRAVLGRAKDRMRLDGRRTIFFIDEIHRFTKAQQDVLMPDIEEGNPILVGATTHNPYFSIISPLISRSQIFELKALAEGAIEDILNKALRDKDRGLGAMKVEAERGALRHIAKRSEGDARRALNAMEVGVLTTSPDKGGVIRFGLKDAEESIQKKALLYDKNEDGHYDTISAFIKSMRGTDPDAALYWLAKMIRAGEDPRFIARRIVICAAEDVGNADPQAIVVANAALQISEFVGMPEARIPLAQATVYIACAPKSNAAYLGIEMALSDVEKARVQEVPDHLKDATGDGDGRLGHGQGYKYAHDHADHYVEQEYMPEKKRYYIPTTIGYEKKIKDWLEYLKKGQGSRVKGQ